MYRIEGWFYDQSGKKISCHAFVNLEEAYTVDKVQKEDYEVITFCAPGKRIVCLKEHAIPDSMVFWSAIFPKEAHNGN